MKPQQPAMTLKAMHFDSDDMERAATEWGANCGPSALAFALDKHINEVRGVIPDFEQKRYTSPSMMKAALESLGKHYDARPAIRSNMFADETALVRVQWCGPWTQPGANPKWAYWHTHWIATVMEQVGRERFPIVFDCNSGMVTYAEWEQTIAPALMNYPRCNGEWIPTHIWRLMDGGLR